MNDSPVVIYSAANRAQAYLLMDWLREQGIEAQVTNDSLEVAGGELPLGWQSAPKIVVPQGQSEKARQLVNQYETLPRKAEEDGDGASEAGSTSDHWPECPRCLAPRPTLCPHCGTSGSSFQQAWLGREGEGDFLVVCPTCDEPFRPEFYRVCHRCGHDFGSGLETPSAKPTLSEREPLKVWLALIGLGVATAAVVSYFAWVLTR